MSVGSSLTGFVGAGRWQYLLYGGQSRRLVDPALESLERPVNLDVAAPEAKLVQADRCV